MSGDMSGCHNWGVTATGISWLEVRDAAKYPMMHRTVPQNV